jgi:DNA-binding SARP family transcriptional activator
MGRVPETALEVTLVGDVVVGRPGDDGHPLSGPSRVVLAALVVERATGVSRDRLAGIIWPEEMPRTWASALRTHVSRVRGLLAREIGGGGETVASADAHYRLVLPPGVTMDVDLDRAAVALDDARRAVTDDPATALREADRATDLLRPPFLPGHTGEWVDGVRARLDDMLIGALEVTSAAATALGDGARAVAAAEDAVRRVPLRESAHRALIAALDGAGNRAEALRAYHRLRQDLRDELGIDPSEDTDAAYLDLLGGPAATAATPATVATSASETASPARKAAGPRHRVEAQAAAAARVIAAPLPFVGRRDELAELAAAWHQAARGARHVVVVTGEAGIGKSRLTTEAARAVHADGGLVLFGRCDQEAIVPYQPLAEALDALVAETSPDDLPYLGDDALAELATVLPSLDVRRPAPIPDRARLFGAVTDLVAALAKERPLMLVLDDLQWADDDTLLLVRHLLRRARDAPLLVVAISRDHDLQPGHALAGVVHSLERDGWVRRLPLRGLAEVEVRELIGHLRGEGDHTASARRLVGETAGNPYLVAELARHEDAAGGAGGNVIPPSVQDLVATRIAGLDKATVDLLRAGAVAGVRFDLDIAGAAAGLHDDALLDAADAALVSGLVVEETADRYRFPHDIVRRGLIGGLSGARRRARHGRPAGALALLRAPVLDAHAAELAYHSAAGAHPAGDERAVRWARRASALATRRSALAEAVRLCRQASAHVPPGRADLQAEVTTDLGIALIAASDPAGARTLARGAELARRHDRPDVLRRAALALADAAGDRTEVRTIARELVESALASGDTWPAGGAITVTGAGVTPSGGRSAVAAGPAAATASDAAAASAVDRARLLVRRHRLAGPAGLTTHAAEPVPEPALRALDDGIAALTGPGDVDERQRLADELTILADIAGNPTYQILAAHEQAMVAAQLGDPAATAAALDRMSSVVATHHDAFGEAMLAERVVAQLTLDGHLEEACDALGHAVAAVTDHRGTAGPDGADGVERRHRGVIDWLSGADAQADDASTAAGVLPHEPGEVHGRGAATPVGDDHLHTLAVAALVACDEGDHAAAAALRARLSPYADRVCGTGYRTFAGAAAFHLGRLAALSGDWAEAERHLLSALRLHSAWRSRPWVALTQAALATVLQARGRPGDREWIAGLRAESDYVSATLGLRKL